jgi:peptidoglycan/xylan/chitin deacetylase (PgdA/CDA1 family)
MPLRLIKLLVSLSVAWADRVSAAIRRLLGGQPTTECVVLYYHAIRAAARERFASQMDELARLSVPVDIEDGEPLSEGVRYSAVTFDDAFMSVVENALPELRARKIPCMIFVPTGSLGRYPSWIGASHEDAAEIVASAEVVRMIADEPLIRIGSHSVSHPDFRRLDDGQAMEELTGSKATLEEILGREVKSFSFPHGAHTPRSLDLARECGYTRVFTIDPVRLRNPREAFAIGRVRVGPQDWPIEFRLKALGAYRWMARASAMKRQLLGAVRGGRVRAPQPRQGL